MHPAHPALDGPLIDNAARYRSWIRVQTSVYSGSKPKSIVRRTREEQPVFLALSTPPVPQKIAERIWRGEFVVMWELLPVKGPEVKSSKERKDKKAPKIQSIPTWVLGFSVYVVVMVKKHPERVPTYVAQIVQASRSSGQQKFRGNPWVTHHHMQAAALGHTNVVEVNTLL